MKHYPVTRTAAAILLLIILSVSSMQGARPRAGKASDADVRKAEAIFLEAVDAEEDGRSDDAFMLLRRAHSLNPSDPYISGAMAEYTVGLPTSDSLDIENAYSAVAARFRANPADEQNAYVYASMAQRLGRDNDLIEVWETLDSLMPSRTDPAMNLSQALMRRYARQGAEADFDRAMAILDRLENAAGPSLPLATGKIQAYALRKDTVAIRREIAKLAASAPADIMNNIIVARLYAGIGMPDSALAFLDKAEAIDPSNGKVYLSRALVYQSENDSVAYDREIFRALQAPAIDYQDKFQLLSDYVVKLYSDSLQRPRIEQMFETIQEVNPGEATLHALYGAYKASTGDADAAAEQFGYSVELDPSQENVWQSLLQVYLQQKRTADVVDASRRALRIFPGNPYFVVNSALALAMEKREAQALAMLDSIDDRQMTNDRLASSIKATRGDLLYSIGERDSAFKAYSEAIDLDPENYMALNNCAYYMAETGRDLDRAELYASIATASDPTNTTYLDTYAWIFFKKKDYKRAREEMDKALELIAKNPEEEKASADIYSHAGDIYFMLGDHREAVAFWRKAHKLDPDDALLAKKVKQKTFFYSLDDDGDDEDTDE